jgi:hypothetical protein
MTGPDQEHVASRVHLSTRARGRRPDLTVGKVLQHTATTLYDLDPPDRG